MYRTLHWINAVKLVHRVVTEVQRNFDGSYDLEDELGLDWLSATIELLSRFTNNKLLTDDAALNYPETWKLWNELLSSQVSKISPGMHSYPNWITNRVLIDIRCKLEPINYISVDDVLLNISQGY